MTSFQRLTDINANPLQGGELAIDFRARLNYLRNREAYQVGLIFLDDQQINSFQLLSFTPAISELPALRADESGYLHITWLEQALSGDYLLYYATTEPLAKTELDTITNEDRMRLAEVWLFGLLSGVVLVPFPIFWVTGPLVLTLLTSRLPCDIVPITAPGTLFTIVWQA